MRTSGTPFKVPLCGDRVVGPFVPSRTDLRPPNVPIPRGAASAPCQPPVVASADAARDPPMVATASEVVVFGRVAYTSTDAVPVFRLPMGLPSRRSPKLCDTRPESGGEGGLCVAPCGTQLGPVPHGKQTAIVHRRALSSSIKY